MRTRSRTWILKVVGDGCDVLRNGRQLRFDVTDGVARRFIREHMRPGDRVRLQEADGYQSDITVTIGKPA